MYSTQISRHNFERCCWLNIFSFPLSPFFLWGDNGYDDKNDESDGDKGALIKNLLDACIQSANSRIDLQKCFQFQIVYSYLNVSGLAIIDVSIVSTRTQKGPSKKDVEWYFYFYRLLFISSMGPLWKPTTSSYSQSIGCTPLLLLHCFGITITHLGFSSSSSSSSSLLSPKRTLYAKVKKAHSTFSSAHYGHCNNNQNCAERPLWE